MSVNTRKSELIMSRFCWMRNFAARSSKSGGVRVPSSMLTHCVFGSFNVSTGSPVTLLSSANNA
ncbi:hypothetical protein D3C83_176180 [compost metagenome]